MIQHIITDLCHHLEIGIDGNLDIGNKRVIVDTPTITLIGNTFTISCSTSNVNIYYTLDGSTPTSNSIRYTSAVTLSSNCTIKAIAIKGNKYSAIAEETYVKPITYLTQWKIVGNSEVHGNEIWSCGEYSEVDGKYHILVKPQGGSIADIALDEPLKKVNDVADTIEFPVVLEAFCNTDGSQIQTTLSDDTILHIQNLVTNINNISTSYLTVTKNNNGSVTLVGNNNTGNYNFQNIGGIKSIPTLNNTYFMTGVTGGSNAKYDIRYGGNLTCYNDDNLLKVTTTSGQGSNVSVMLRAGNSIDATLFFLMLCIDDMFADATDYIPTDASDFRTMFPNLTYIENTANTIDVIVKGGKLYKYVETEGKALVTIRVEESGGKLSPLVTPITELVDAPQIEKANNYTCEISQGAKAVNWSSFITNPS